ncbi:MAG: hypothetical protein ACI9U2_000392 [Bradymonadia bacterium]|jgi:hypothetical protein
MDREIVVALNGNASRLAFKKVDRKALYGSRKRVSLDPAGAECAKGELTADAALLIRQGMAAQGYFDQSGLWYAQKHLTGLNADGSEAEKIDSTLGVEQALVKLDPTRVLDARVSVVYALDPADIDGDLQIELDADGIFEFAFNYRAGYAPRSGFLVANPSGMYVLVGRPTEPDWCSLETPPVDPLDDDDGLDDDLDFEMF